MVAVVFPGQGSQKPGMGKSLCEESRAAAEVFDAVERATGIPVRQVCFELGDDELRQTQNAQIALYTCGVAAWRCLASEMPALEPRFMAGHSIGEYAALACAGILSVEDGARLVKRRGEVMAQSGRLRPGGMAAILGMERGDLDALCKECSTDGGAVVIANDNCPGQLVVSGDKAAVERLCGVAPSKGAKRALPLNVSGAFHSPLMHEAARLMGDALAGATFGVSHGPSIVCNVTAEPTGADANWANLLERQLSNPVRWTESVQRMLADGATTFIECGGGEVLSGLIRRIDRDAKCLQVADIESVAKVAAEVG